LEAFAHPEGIAATIARLRTLTPALIVVEATGVYERSVPDKGSETPWNQAYDVSHCECF
jgi:hypothetical protein